MIQSIKDKLDSIQEEFRASLREKEDSLLGNTSQMEVYKKQLCKINESLDSGEFSSEDDIDLKIHELETNLESYKKLKTDTESDITYFESVVADFHKDQSAIVLNNKEKVDFQIKNYNEIIQPFKEEQTELKYKAKALDNEIKKLDSITDVCPTCGQKIPDVVKIDTTEMKSEYSKLLEDIKKVEKQVSESEKTHEFTLENLKKELDEELKEFESNLSAQTNKLSELKTYLTNLNKQVSDTTQKLFELRGVKENYDRLMKDKTEVLEKIEELEQSDLELNAVIVSTRSYLDIVQQLITLAKREFRGILLSNIIEFINKKVKQYSLAVFGTTELNFALNENCIDITYNDKMYENMSGGEKQKIDIIIQLALRDILSKQLNIHTNLLICDEIYDNMDGISCQKITNLISTLTDISSIFIISHHAQDLEITYDSNLLVEKDENGVSKISFV